VKLDFDALTDFGGLSDASEIRRLGTRHLAGKGAWFDPSWEGGGAWVEVWGTPDCSYSGGDYRPDEFCPAAFLPTEHDLGLGMLLSLAEQGSSGLNQDAFDRLVFWLESFFGIDLQGLLSFDQLTGFPLLVGHDELNASALRQTYAIHVWSALFTALISDGVVFEPFWGESVSGLLSPRRPLEESLRREKVERRVWVPLVQSEVRRVALGRRLSFDKLHGFQRLFGRRLARVGLPDVVRYQKVYAPDPTGQQWCECVFPGPWTLHRYDGSESVFASEQELIGVLWSDDLREIDPRLESEVWVRAVVFALGQAGWVGGVGDGVLVVRNALAEGRTNVFELL
jgi:hypothetical protein